ncbi:hypothetical protein PVAND_014911 [Polypedilum vanderplanki]|uniref:Lipase domain-containing protein n=1 Tax=Polypedilum vanderplanki TaxID=319348 RepID=A0A9J6BBG1_POLVA|nr:hypothetical protein PVAND_014911 [Polypedilum vanderplanki]
MLEKRIFLFLALLTITNADERLRFIFYQEPTKTVEYNFNTFHNILTDPYFNRNLHTVLFHYGAGQNLNTPQVYDLVNSYAVNRNFNYVVIHYLNPDTTVATSNVNELAEGIATALIGIFDRGYSSGYMDLLGFALGAQIQARASRRVQARTNHRHVIGRLTGLDPWALGPINSITIGSLSSADAQWVESIHTEGSQRGDLESNGHVSFFVNGGIAQPMCNQALPTARWDCSHVFALSVWAESVRAYSPVFPSLQCSTWEQFIAGACNNNNLAHMGRLNSESILRGRFFLTTNMQAPWSRNQAQP